MKDRTHDEASADKWDGESYQACNRPEPHPDHNWIASDGHTVRCADETVRADLPADGASAAKTEPRGFTPYERGFEAGVAHAREEATDDAFLTYGQAHQELKEGEIRHYLGWLYGKGYVIANLGVVDSSAALGAKQVPVPTGTDYGATAANQAAPLRRAAVEPSATGWCGDYESHGPHDYNERRCKGNRPTAVETTAARLDHRKQDDASRLAYRVADAVKDEVQRWLRRERPWELDTADLFQVIRPLMPEVLDVKAEKGTDWRAEFEAERLVRIRYQDALERIASFEPEFHEWTPEQVADQQACVACPRNHDNYKGWPPSGLCHEHYRVVMGVQRRNADARAMQHLDMRTLARGALTAPDVTEGAEAGYGPRGGLAGVDVPNSPDGANHADAPKEPAPPSASSFGGTDD